MSFSTGPGQFINAMNTYAYEAVNAAGLSSTGFIEVATQNEAVRRIKEMAFFQRVLRSAARIASRKPSPNAKSQPTPDKNFDSIYPSPREIRRALRVNAPDRHAGGRWFHRCCAV